MLGLCAALAGPAAAPAAEDWRTQPFPYHAIDQDITAALAALGRHLGIELRVSDAVRGRVRQLAAADAGGFLDALAERHGLDWFHDGRRLHVSADSEAIERVLPMGSAGAARLEAGLRDLGLAGQAHQLTFSAASNTVLVAGPPRYVGLVEQAVANLQAPPQAPAITVIYGRQADAS